jgi:hypothetical protein
MGAAAPDRMVGPSLRLRRIIEIIYQVDGVTGARLWHWSGRVAVGLTLSAASSPAEVIARVMTAVAPLCDVNETWEFGILADR